MARAHRGRERYPPAIFALTTGTPSFRTSRATAGMRARLRPSSLRAPSGNMPITRPSRRTPNIWRTVRESFISFVFGIEPTSCMAIPRNASRKMLSEVTNWMGWRRKALIQKGSQ